jgi:Phage portal protein, SPP1 Gp6-like
VPDSPEEWFAFLSDKLASRLPELVRLQQYVTGCAPLPKGATQFAESYAAWQKMSRTNFAERVVDSKADRMKIAGFRVGQDHSDNDAARRIWRRSQGGGMAADVHRDALTYGLGYAMASEGRRGAVLTRESPFTTVVETDPLDPTWVLAGLKVWSDRKVDHAVLHLPGEVHKFVRSRPGRTRLPSRPQLIGGGGWGIDPDPDMTGPTGLGRVPIVEFVNRDGIGEFANHTDLLDRINWVILQRLLITAMQAFRQRALEDNSDPDEDPLPEEDEDGQPIDWNEEFIAGPDALWVLPRGVRIWESSPGDLQQILTSAKDDLGQLAAVTGTPMPTLMPGDGQNQTAEGAAFARESLVFAAGDRVERFTAKWDDLMGSALAIDKVDDQVETQWTPVERVSLAERFDALSKAGTDVPWRTKMTDILGFPSDQVDRMELERSSDALLVQPPAVV